MRLIAPYFLAAAAAVAAPTYDADRLLRAIAEVEQHKDHWLGGRHAITRAAWLETMPRWGYHLSRSPYHADIVARKRLRDLGARLEVRGVVVTAYTLAGCWHLGFDGFMAANQRGAIDYSARVWNLYFEKPYAPSVAH